MAPEFSPPLFVELFAGRGAFSKAALQSGFRAVSVDHEVVQPFAPVVTLDLTTETGTRILWDIMRAPGLEAVHLGLPCGTSSRARELPIPLALRRAGVPEPRPLRSAAHPLGIPGLAAHHQRRVDSANVLYQLAIEIILWCDERNIIISIENPANSWLWAALVTLARNHSARAARALSKLCMVKFHACCHGSTRRKQTGWLSTPKVFDALNATCKNDHEHEPWGVRFQAGAWVFDTSTEAHYPHLLGQRATACLVNFLAARGRKVTKPLRLHDKSTAALGRQTKKHRPLVPEYHHVKVLQAGEKPPADSKLLPPHFQGAMECDEGTNETDGQATRPLAEVQKCGIYHNPKQFLSMAEKAVHPMDSADHLEGVTKYALDFVFKYPAHVVKLERRKNLLQAKLLGLKLADEERALHSTLPPSLNKVLSGKNLLLWHALLEKYGYDDMAVVPFMMKGVELVGMPDTPACYPPMLKPATLLVDDLQNSAVWRRKAVLGKVHQADPSHIEHLESTALEELELGFVEGPFSSEQEVSNHLGREDWCVVRRFVLVQGAEMKLRPIDDCLEAQLNQAYTVTSYLKLQDIDYITGLTLCIAEKLAGASDGPGIEAWLGKCLDLSKAYKQMGIHPANRHLAVIFYHDAHGAPKFYVANALMFGSTAAVYSFNRVSRSLWFLFNKMLAIPCGVFYDDFPMFQPCGLATDADESASQLLDLLGWKHAKTGSKAAPYQARFNVLGCTLDLTDISSGSVKLENKPGRIDRLVELLKKTSEEGTLTKHQGQVIHGLMRYACGFFSGKYLHQVCAEVMAIGSAHSKKGPAEVRSFCDYAIRTLQTSRPRQIHCGFEKRPILIFTDGCWEAGFAGIGAVISDLATGVKIVCSGVVPSILIETWKKSVGDFVICQIELYVMVLLRWQFSRQFTHRRTIWWVDNDSARYTTIKGLSPSPTMRLLAREFYALDADFPTYSWVERVPSKSNPADGPSRNACAETLELLGLSSSTAFEHPRELVERLTAGL